MTDIVRRRTSSRQLDGAAEELADGLGRAFAGLAGTFRRLREENGRLRAENDRLRAVLGECVEACGSYLGPLFDDVDHDRARLALIDARRALS